VFHSTVRRRVGGLISRVLRARKVDGRLPEAAERDSYAIELYERDPATREPGRTGFGEQLGAAYRSGQS
jgi:hypothetical protein